MRNIFFEEVKKKYFHDLPLPQPDKIHFLMAFFPVILTTITRLRRNQSESNLLYNLNLNKIKKTYSRPNGLRRIISQNT